MTATGKIIGKEGTGNVHEEADNILAASMKPDYESKEFTVANGTNSKDVKATEGAFGAALPRAHSVLIRSDQNITIRFNDDANDDITVFADVEFPISTLEVTNIFIDNNSGNPAAVKIILG